MHSSSWVSGDPCDVAVKGRVNTTCVHRWALSPAPEEPAAAQMVVTEKTWLSQGAENKKLKQCVPESVRRVRNAACTAREESNGRSRHNQLRLEDIREAKASRPRPSGQTCWVPHSPQTHRQGDIALTQREGCQGAVSSSACLGTLPLFCPLVHRL